MRAWAVLLAKAKPVSVLILEKDSPNLSFRLHETGPSPGGRDSLFTDEKTGSER